MGTNNGRKRNKHKNQKNQKEKEKRILHEQAYIGRDFTHVAPRAPRVCPSQQLIPPAITGLVSDGTLTGCGLKIMLLYRILLFQLRISRKTSSDVFKTPKQTRFTKMNYKVSDGYLANGHPRRLSSPTNQRVIYLAIEEKPLATFN